jgi:hypothetical protein
MHICRKPVCQHAEKQRGALIRQQVKIVDEEITGRLARQRMAQIIYQQAAARRVRRAGILPQEGKARAGKRLLCAFPEDRKVVGIYADADAVQGLRSGTLTEIPVHRRGLPVAHGRDHRGHGAAGDGPQALLQPLGYVNGVQIPLRFWHPAYLRRCILPQIPARPILRLL